MQAQHLISIVGLICLVTGMAAPAAARSATTLPDCVRPVWDLGRAQRGSTRTRERICIDGLWRWQPAEADAGAVPQRNWGHSKVSGCWPGITDCMQKSSQKFDARPAWDGVALRGISAAWYQREIAVPENRAGRRTAVTADYLNSLAGGEDRWLHGFCLDEPHSWGCPDRFFRW